MLPSLSSRATRQTTSAIRDLLEHARRPGMISLAGGLPDPEAFPVDHLAALAAAAIRTEPGEVLQYGLTAGSVALREHIAATTPSATTPEAVVVTTGSQQALDLLGAVLLDPGDPVVVGDPDYLGALQAFRSTGAALCAIPVDEGGFDADALEDRLAGGIRPKLVYVVPHFHNPTGATLAPGRADALLALADRYGFLVVFDDPYRDLGVDGAPGEPGPHPNAVHLRSVSKVLAPGLRVGWMIGPRQLVSAVERAKQAADLHTSGLGQAVALGALRAPWFPTHVAELRAATRTRRDALIGALTTAFGDVLHVSRPAGGMFVWATFADGTDTGALLERALDAGVAFVPGAAFAVERDRSASLRLSWATAAPDALGEAATRLARAHRAHRTPRSASPVGPR